MDSLAMGHVCQLLCDAPAQPLGYFVVMPGFEEMHLLNLTVAPAVQGRGLGRLLLESVVRECQAFGVKRLWLEVRTGNHRARLIYERFGFEAQGKRKGYYPAALGAREDAIVMSLSIPTPPGGSRHATQ